MNTITFDFDEGVYTLMEIRTKRDDETTQSCLDEGKRLERLFLKLEAEHCTTHNERQAYETLLECLRRNYRKGVWYVDNVAECQ